MASFEPEHQKIKGSGREKGTKNKNTVIRDWIRSFTIEYLEDEEGFRADFAKLKPSERVGTIKDMFKYTVPTMTSVKFEDDSQSITAREHLRDIMSYK